MEATKKKFSVRDMTLIGVLTALLAVLSQIAIPFPSGIPITLQTFAVAFIGVIAGTRNSIITMLLYILLGAIGVPVFANFKSGVAALVGPTGGFIIGFIFMAVCCALSVKLKNIFVGIALCLLGLLLCHAAGCLQFTLLTQNTFWQAAMIASVPYLIKDVISVVAAYFIGKKVKTMLARIMNQ